MEKDKENIETCKLCLEEKTLIKSHIIPKSFYSKPNEKPLYIVSSGNSSPKKSQIGIYDNNLVCSECEKKFDKSDSYIRSLYNDYVDNIKLNTREQVIVKGVKSDLILYFCNSLLWRASSTKNDIFRNVDVGPYSEDLRQSVKDNNSFFTDISFFYCTNSNHLPIPPPFRHRFSNVNYYLFFLDRLKIHIKVDSQVGADQFVDSRLNIEKNMLKIFPFHSDDHGFSKIAGIISENAKNEGKFKYE